MLITVSLPIPEQNKLAAAQTNFVLNGIACRKMTAEQYKVVLLRKTAKRY